LSDSISFEVVGYSYSRKAGKGPVYKVLFKNPEGHALTLVGSSRDIYAGFPLGDQVQVTIVRSQRTLEEGPEA